MSPEISAVRLNKVYWPVYIGPTQIGLLHDTCHDILPFIIMYLKQRIVLVSCSFLRLLVEWMVDSLVNGRDLQRYSSPATARGLDGNFRNQV